MRECAGDGRTRMAGDDGGGRHVPKEGNDGARDGVDVLQGEFERRAQPALGVRGRGRAYGVREMDRRERVGVFVVAVAKRGVKAQAPESVVHGGRAREDRVRVGTDLGRGGQSYR